MPTIRIAFHPSLRVHVQPFKPNERFFKDVQAFNFITDFFGCTFKASGKPSSCFVDYSDEESGTACLVQRGYGKKAVGQALMADRFDLNADGVPDYLLSDRYSCGSLSANQSNVYLVMLSQPGGQYDLAYADCMA